MVGNVVAVEDDVFKFTKASMALLTALPRLEAPFNPSNLRLSRFELFSGLQAKPARRCDEVFLVGHRANIPLAVGPVKTWAVNFWPCTSAQVGVVAFMR